MSNIVLAQKPIIQLAVKLAVATIAAATLAVVSQRVVADEVNSSATENSISQARATELAHMVKHDCGSCHGMTLKGGLGPSLLPEEFKDKNMEYIKLSILHGRNGTAMPPWNAILSDDDAQWIAEYLLSGKINKPNQ